MTVASRNRTSDKYPGAEPLPGYRLLQLLGRGGFGDVWKCEAPGGLHKAVKFVAAGGEQFRQELAAFEQVRAIRHPYLLTLERVELVGGELVMVMELADCQINDRFRESREEGHRGIPRAELLGYLKEAAEALDMMSNRYKLQHLDVKPENIFLVSGHVKIGDYGLVRSRKNEDATDANFGFTPLYTAPEVHQGRVDPRSDQYSLALVYVRLLTGEFPYSGQTSQQLVLQHQTVPPNLSMLPSCDRPTVSRALSKAPPERYRTCSEFIASLNPAVVEEIPEFAEVLPAASAAPSEDLGATVSVRTPQPANPEPRTFVEPPKTPTPQAITRAIDRRSTRRVEPEPVVDPSRRFDAVVSLDRLHGMPDSMARQAGLSRSHFVRAVVAAAMSKSARPSDLTRPADAVTCRFMSTFPAALIPFKLAVVAERWGTSMRCDVDSVVMRYETSSRTPCGYEVVLERPVPPGIDYTAVGAVFGPAEDAFRDKARTNMESIVEETRKLLQNLEDRRASPRFAADFPVLVYPQYSDGEVGEPMLGTCVDVSTGGVRVSTPLPVRTEFCYLELKDIEAVAGQAIQIRVLRTAVDHESQSAITVGRFRSRATS